MDINITDIAVAVIGLCGTLITAYLIPWIQRNASAKTLENAKFWAGIAVQAAESIYTDPGMGQAKKMYVLEYLASKGIKVDDAQVEAAVYELINGFTKGLTVTTALEADK